MLHIYTCAAAAATADVEYFKSLQDSGCFSLKRVPSVRMLLRHNLIADYHAGAWFENLQ